MVLGLALALGLYGGASHAQAPTCVGSDGALRGVTTVGEPAHPPLIAECTALLRLKHATYPSLNWSREVGMNIWQSVGLNAGKTRVARLTLGPSYLLTGTLPDLSALDALTYLRIGHNPDLTAGPMPAWVGTLTNLTHLDLRGNNFTGSIRNLSALTKLEELHLQDNDLSGSIPNLSALTELRTLDLSRNELTGSIPTTLTSLAKLETLNLARNRLTGAVPSMLGLKKLKHLNLNDNDLSGGFPANLQAPLETLELGNNFRFDRGVGNGFTGTIPALNGFTALKHVRLQDNKFTGALPALPTSLVELSAHFNQLTSFNVTGTLTSLQRFNVRGNKMTTWSGALSAITSMEHLHLAQNSFNTSRPSVGTLTSLKTLSLCGNTFTGSLPTATAARVTSGALTMGECLSVANASGNEGENLSFNVTYSRLPAAAGTRSVQVSLAAEEGTAVEHLDYTYTTTPVGVAIAGGAASGTGAIEVTAVADCHVDDGETFTIKLTAPTSSTSNVLWSYDHFATGTITEVAAVEGCVPPRLPAPPPAPDPDPDDPDDDPDDPDDDPEPEPEPEPEPDPNRFVAPYWQGTGGIVVKPANGLSVKFEMSCRGARTTERLYANDDGLIVQLVRRDACMDDDGNPVRGELSVRDIEPGGWYWVDGPRNAAVAPLVSEVELGGDAAAIPAGVETDVTANGTFFEHEAGRMIGIVPHLPTPDADACSEYVSPYWRGAGGIVVKPTDGESAKLRTTCGGWNATQTLLANDEGLVVQLLRGDSSSTACTDDAGNPMRGELSFEGVRPGGWYWVNGPRNAAVAPLVCRDTLNGPAATVPVGVDADEGNDGTLFEHDVAMLIGIVPHLRRPPEE